jgi:phosphate/sulfate permease
MAASEQVARRPARVRLLAWVVAAAIALAIAIAFLVAMRRPTAEQRALSRMAPDERRAVYERAMENLKVLCGRGPRTDALERECTTQIEFLLQFPECDDACRSIAQMHQPLPKK